MTVLESFVTFARSLPASRLEAIEDTLAMLMESYSATHEFSAKDLATLDRRLAEDRPAFANASDIEQLLGRKLPG